MNILIPHKWLLEQLETSATPEELQKNVSLCGPSVERIYDKEGDSVYDIEVTTNRVDSMSVRGIAREAAVILSRAGMPSKLKPLALPDIPAPQSEPLPMPKITLQTDACKRTLCVILDNVSHAATPDWMATRLQQVEQNVHDAMIDITNYITHELGHPCHAFDYDKIMALGGEIIVTEAKAGLLFVTLDGESYETVGGEIVYLNPAGEVIDLPAIKGTANTAVDDSTKRVLFWIESLEADKVRFASMTHAIRTVAAQLNEKKVDPMLAMPVFQRGVELYRMICGASVASPILDVFPQPPKLTSINVPTNEVQRYLGIPLTQDEITTILTELECQVNWSENSFTVNAPSFRPDLSIPADVIEELARIYGYHKLPSKLMDGPIPIIKPVGTDFGFEIRLKEFLAALGWFEVYTYSLVSEAIAAESGWKTVEHLKLANPLTDDKIYLRRSLLPSLSEVLINNPQYSKASVFETAMVYHKRDTNLPQEKLKLGLVTTQPYTNLRGSIEALLSHWFIQEVHITPVSTTDNQPLLTQFSQVATLTVGGVELGYLGVLKNGHAAAEVDMAVLLQVIQTHPTYVPLPKTSPIIEDLTITLPPQTEIGALLDAWKKADSLIKDVTVSSTYQQNVTLTVTYWSPEKTLTVEEVTPIRKQLVVLAEKVVNGKLVGQLA